MVKKKIEVRPYKSSDAQDLAQIYYNTIHQVNAKDYSKIQLDAWAPESSAEAEYWVKKLKKTNPLVAISNGTIVGFAEFEPNGHTVVGGFFVFLDMLLKMPGQTAGEKKSLGSNCFFRQH